MAMFLILSKETVTILVSIILGLMRILAMAFVMMKIVLMALTGIVTNSRMITVTAA